MKVELADVAAWIKANPCLVCDGTRADCDDMADALTAHFRKQKCGQGVGYEYTTDDGVGRTVFRCSKERGHRGSHVDDESGITFQVFPPESS